MNLFQNKIFNTDEQINKIYSQVIQACYKIYKFENQQMKTTNINISNNAGFLTNQ